MDDELRTQWEQFLNGHWQLEMPQKPGVYPTKNKTLGTQHLDVVVVETGDGLLLYPYDFGGYFWSEPRPNMPGCRQ